MSNDALTGQTEPTTAQIAASIAERSQDGIEGAAARVIAHKMPLDVVVRQFIRVYGHEALLAEVERQTPDVMQYGGFCASERECGSSCPEHALNGGPNA